MARPRTKTVVAFTRLELLVIMAALMVVLALLLPQLTRSRVRVKRIGCVNCLKQVTLAVRTWAIDNGDLFPMQVSVTNGGTQELATGRAVFPLYLVMSNELSTPKLPSLPG